MMHAPAMQAPVVQQQQQHHSSGLQHVPQAEAQVTAPARLTQPGELTAEQRAWLSAWLQQFKQQFEEFKQSMPGMTPQ